jgi:hypothetical protein
MIKAIQAKMAAMAKNITVTSGNISITAAAAAIIVTEIISRVKNSLLRCFTAFKIPSLL